MIQTAATIARPQPSGTSRKWHVEVAVRPTAASKLEFMRNWWKEYLQSGKGSTLNVNRKGDVDLSFTPTEIQQACINVKIMNEDSCPPTLSLDHDDPRAFEVFTYILSNEESCIEELEPTGGDDEWTAGCDNLSLPHTSLDGVWESLIFESQIKRQLLSQAQSALLFSDKKVSSHIIQWNRMILLHG
jgi:pachytene checkpoint protein 2